MYPAEWGGPPSQDIKIEEKNVKVLDSYNLLFLQMRQVVLIQIRDVELGYLYMQENVLTIW